MKIKRYIFIGFSICLVFFIFSNLRKKENTLSAEEKAYIEKALSSLTKKEMKYLQEFFDFDFFFIAPVPYTIFGSKPVSEASIWPVKRAKRGWEAWKKIAPYFQSKKFIIRECMIRKQATIYVANLEEIERIYYQNEQLFKGVLKENITFDLLKQSIIENGPLFQKVMKNHLLAGIMFGFGTLNAQLFTTNFKLPRKKRERLPFFVRRGHLIFYWPSGVLPIGFVCHPNTDETKELKKRYGAERKRIKKLVKGDGLLINMLAELKRTS